MAGGGNEGSGTGQEGGNEGGATEHGWENERSDIGHQENNDSDENIDEPAGIGSSYPSQRKRKKDKETREAKELRIKRAKFHEHKNAILPTDVPTILSLKSYLHVMLDDMPTASTPLTKEELQAKATEYLRDRFGTSPDCYQYTEMLMQSLTTLNMDSNVHLREGPQNCYFDMMHIILQWEEIVQMRMKILELERRMT